MGFRCPKQVCEAIDKIKYPLYLNDIHNKTKKLQIKNKSSLMNYLIIFAIYNNALPDSLTDEFKNHIEVE
jgi:hypothetical protein